MNRSATVVIAFDKTVDSKADTDGDGYLNHWTIDKPGLFFKAEFKGRNQIANIRIERVRGLKKLSINVQKVASGWSLRSAKWANNPRYFGKVECDEGNRVSDSVENIQEVATRVFEQTQASEKGALCREVPAFGDAQKWLMQTNRPNDSGVSELGQCIEGLASARLIAVDLPELEIQKAVRKISGATGEDFDTTIACVRDESLLDKFGWSVQTCDPKSPSYIFLNLAARGFDSKPLKDRLLHEFVHIAMAKTEAVRAGQNDFQAAEKIDEIRKKNEETVNEIVRCCGTTKEQQSDCARSTEARASAIADQFGAGERTTGVRKTESVAAVEQAVQQATDITAQIPAQMRTQIEQSVPAISGAAMNEAMAAEPTATWRPTPVSLATVTQKAAEPMIKWAEETSDRILKEALPVAEAAEVSQNSMRSAPRGEDNSSDDSQDAAFAAMNQGALAAAAGAGAATVRAKGAAKPSGSTTIAGQASESRESDARAAQRANGTRSDSREPASNARAGAQAGSESEPQPGGDSSLSSRVGQTMAPGARAPSGPAAAAPQAVTQAAGKDRRPGVNRGSQAPLPTNTARSPAAVQALESVADQLGRGDIGELTVSEINAALFQPGSGRIDPEFDRALKKRGVFLITAGGSAGDAKAPKVKYILRGETLTRASTKK